MKNFFQSQFLLLHFVCPRTKNIWVGATKLGRDVSWHKAATEIRERSGMARGCRHYNETAPRMQLNLSAQVLHPDATLSADAKHAGLTFFGRNPTNIEALICKGEVKMLNTDYAINLDCALFTNILFQPPPGFSIIPARVSHKTKQPCSHFNQKPENHKKLCDFRFSAAMSEFLIASLPLKKGAKEEDCSSGLMRPYLHPPNASEDVTTPSVVPLWLTNPPRTHSARWRRQQSIYMNNKYA